ncbi:DinB family protein [Azohydromonas sediminis]|uniref:DinB family protein n=1 Tax=Azohydromonas sediminis TaxID=2259674 RepID=UPI000E64E308|nr:DinB family protein [Azohydromonas sediminis]
MHALRDQLLTMARYEAWATRRLLDHVERLSDDAYRRDVGLFFRSVHGTLNHLLVGQCEVWLGRFAHGRSARVALNAELETDRARLRARLVEGAAAWVPWLAGVPDERLHGTLDYTTTQGQPQTTPFAPTLAHVFNHGTHHRGQVTAAITALGHPAPELDLILMLREEARPA